jgi:hypothetical protein
MAKDSKVPAFPQPFATSPALTGMSLREWYAGLAMQGLLSAGAMTMAQQMDEQKVAGRAFAIADAMMYKLAE